MLLFIYKENSNNTFKIFYNLIKYSQSQEKLKGRGKLGLASHFFVSQKFQLLARWPPKTNLAENFSRRKDIFPLSLTLNSLLALWKMKGNFSNSLVSQTNRY